MKFSTSTNMLGFSEINFETTSEQSVEADINLPDYCAEIKRILKCTVNADIISVQNTDGKITAQGNATVRVIYIGDNDMLSAYEQTYPVQKTVESDKVSSGCAVSVRAVTDYVNCRAVSSRRIDIKAMLTFVFRSVRKRDEVILTDASGDGIQTLTSEYSFSNLKTVTEKAFYLTEVIELPSDKPVIGRIINSSAYISVSEKKIINNKILIKGECFIKTYYLTENDSSVEYTEHSIPISQIIEAEGITEDCETVINLNITACEAVSKVDSSGETKLIDINIRVSASILAFENTSVTLITDAYSTECETNNSIKSIDILSVNTSHDKLFTNKVVLESIGVSVESVHAVWCSDIKYNYNLKNNICLLSGNYQVTVLYRDSEKQIGIIQKPVDFEYSVDLSKTCDRIVCYPMLQLCGCSCAVTGESKLELKTEIHAVIKILSSEIVKYLSDIELNREKNNQKEKCALTVYFSDENEKIWNIAKRYRTTVAAIMEENGLESEILKDKKTLLIPVVS